MNIPRVMTKPRFAGLDIYLNHNGRVYIELTEADTRCRYENYLKNKNTKDLEIPTMLEKYSLEPDEVRINGVRLGTSNRVYNISKSLESRMLFSEYFVRMFFVKNIVEDIDTSTADANWKDSDSNGEKTDIKQFFENNLSRIKEAFEKGKLSQIWNSDLGTRLITFEYK